MVIELNLWAWIILYLIGSLISCILCIIMAIENARKKNQPLDGSDWGAILFLTILSWIIPLIAIIAEVIVPEKRKKE